MQDFPKIPPAVSDVRNDAALGRNADCQAQLDIANQRLDKTLDALEKAEKALSFAVAENASRKALDDLKNQFIAVKDMIITEQQKFITLLQSQKKGNSFKDRLLTILKVAEKAATIALGIIIGRGI